MFPSATDEYIRCYRLRDLLSLVGGYVFVGAVVIYPTILPVWSFCPRGVKTSSLFVAYFFHKNSNRFCGIYKMFIFDLWALLEITRANLVPRWHEVCTGNFQKCPQTKYKHFVNSAKSVAIFAKKVSNE